MPGHFPLNVKPSGPCPLLFFPWTLLESVAFLELPILRLLLPLGLCLMHLF